jgi:hypothetical protein
VSLSSTPKRARLNITYTVNQAAATITPSTLSNEIDFETDYKLILERFKCSTDKQHACPASLNKDQRADNLNFFHVAI